MDHDPVRDETMFEDAGIDLESLTVLLVRGGTRAEVIRLLGADEESDGAEWPELEDVDYSAYALADVDGGVVAFEFTGYADPSPRVLAALSALGGAAAVARDNIMAHERFGCARDGELLFDADEFRYADAQARESVPVDVRPLFDAACAREASGFVGYAMAAVHTGVAVTADDLRRARQQGYHRVRSLTYLE